MKKWLYISIGLLLLLTGMSMLIPRVQEKKSSLVIRCPATAINRFVLASEQWEQWWPGKRISGDTLWQIGGKTVRITQQLLNGVRAISEDQTMAFELQFNPANNNETTASIYSTYALPFHPAYRLLAWLKKSNAEKISEELLNSCQHFFSSSSNVYGMDIQKGKVKYFSWISTKERFNHYPSTEEIYQTIDLLERYTKENNGTTLAEPIMHVYRETNDAYELMVAMPTDRDLPSKDRFQLKNMILGSLLTAHVTGGPATVSRAIIELEHYVKDYRLVSPAIPFETLVTNRRMERDSSRWVTLVNYPIFD